MNQKLKEKKNNRFRKIGGITLISLVITIIVLIILASVVIYLNLENNGIFTRAKQAKETTNKQTATEIINLKITTAQMNNYTKEQRMPTLKELSLALGEDNEIKYVSQTSRVASTEYDVPSENPTSIYTKLNKYPYEFEINSSLQLASIDGVKIASNEKTVTITQEEYERLKSKNYDYSTTNEEKIVGKWYDGRTMYEVSIPITLPNGDELIDLSKYNIDTCIIYDGYFGYDNTYYGVPIGYIWSGSTFIVMRIEHGNIRIINKDSTLTGATGYVTLHYTKK